MADIDIQIRAPGPLTSCGALRDHTDEHTQTDVRMAFETQLQAIQALYFLNNGNIRSKYHWKCYTCGRTKHTVAVSFSAKTSAQILLHDSDNDEWMQASKETDYVLQYCWWADDMCDIGIYV